VPKSSAAEPSFLSTARSGKGLLRPAESVGGGGDGAALENSLRELAQSGIEPVEILLFSSMGPGSDVGIAAGRHVSDAIQYFDSYVRVLRGIEVSRKFREICPEEALQESLEFGFGQSRGTRGVIPAALAKELRLDSPSGHAQKPAVRGFVRIRVAALVLAADRDQLESLGRQFP
jgi:hypothetical protein